MPPVDPATLVLPSGRRQDGDVERWDVQAGTAPDAAGVRPVVGLEDMPLGAGQLGAGRDLADAVGLDQRLAALEPEGPAERAGRQDLGQPEPLPHAAGVAADLAPGGLGEVHALEQLAGSPAAGFALVVGILTALWSASGYVGAFSRAMNRVYEIEEGRPFQELQGERFAAVTGERPWDGESAMTGMARNG